MPPGKRSDVEFNTAEKTFGELLGAAWNEVRSHAPGVSRVALSFALRNLANNRACIETIARRMVEDEELDWTVMDNRARRDWMLRARSSVAGLSGFLFHSEQAEKG